MLRHLASALVAAGCVAGESMPVAQADAEGAALARTAVDRAWTATLIGATYEAAVADGGDLDSFAIHGRWTRGGLSLWGALHLYDRANPERGASQSGFGDSEAGASFSVPISPVLRATAGLDAVLNTAADDAYGAGANILRPFIAATLLARHGTSVALEAGYAFDSGKEDGVDDTALADLRLTATARLSEDTFLWLRATPGYDTEDEDVVLAISAGLGLFAGRHQTVRIETDQPLDSDSRDADGWTLRVFHAWTF